MANGLLDLPQDQFMGALDELGIAGARRDELIRAKRNQDSIFGGLFDFFAPQPGMERANLLPMIRPQGMSGLEAITSGQAQFAMPGALTGVTTGLAQAVDAPRAAAQGQIPMQDMAGEAAGVANMLTLGGAGAAGRGLLDYDPTVTRIFAGPRAATANKDALAAARRLSATGASPDEIWNQTGWFKLPDGQWRFEMDDRDIGLRPFEQSKQIAADMEAQAKEIKAGIKQRNADLKVQPDLFPQTLRAEHGRLTRESEALAKAATANYGPLWNPSSLGQRATYAVTDSELQRAYPDLMYQTIVRTNQPLGDYLGSYDEGMQSLNVARESVFSPDPKVAPGKVRSTLLHELQHAVQGVEGFARGTNTDAAEELLRNLRDAEIGQARKLQGELFKQASPELKELLTQRYNARESGEVDVLNDVNARISALPFGQELIAADDAARAASQRVITPQDAYDAYLRHLGELEARLVQERADWSMEKRRATPPWQMESYIPAEQQIKSFIGAPTYPRDIFSAIEQQQSSGLLGAQ